MSGQALSEGDTDDILWPCPAEEATILTTMREVGALAGVSSKTVSRVVNGDRYVSDSVRSRVNKAIEELQYLPNTLAQTFRTGRDTAIGIAIPNMADPFFSAVVQAITGEARAQGSAVLITQLGDTPEDEQSAVESLLQRQVAGLIIAPISADHRYIAKWQQRTQFVFVDRAAHRITADSVVHDDEGGAREATLHLLRAGHRHIAFVGNALAIDTAQRRLQGYRAALAEYGISPNSDLEVNDHDDAGFAARTFTRLLGLAKPPTAIFCSASQLSIRLIPWLHAQNRTDIGFVSFGDFPMADSLLPTVTVIEQDPQELGVTAVRRLFARIETPTRRLKRHLILPVFLKVRDSTPTLVAQVRTAG